MQKVFPSILINLLALSLCFAGEPQKVLSILSHSPVLDGVVNTDEWKDAQILAPLRDLSGKQVSPQTIVHMARGTDGLWLAFECFEPSIGAVKNNIKRADGNVWVDDGIEIFLDTNGDHRSYCHLVVNTDGVVFSQFLCKPEMPGVNPAWYPALRFKSAVLKDRWTAELYIPFASLRSLDASNIGINICRNRFAGGESQYSCLVNDDGGYHNPSAFERFTSKGLMPLFFKYDWGKFQAEYYDGTISIDGLRKLPKSCASAEVWLEDGGGRVVRTEPVNIKPSGRPVKIKASEDIHFIHLIFSDANDNIRATSRRIAVFKAEPVMISITQPYFDIEKDFSAKIRIAEPIRQLEISEMVAMVKSHDGNILWQIKLPADTDSFEVPLVDLSAGDYKLCVDISTADKKLFSGEICFSKITAPKHITKVTINNNGATLIDGKAFLPVGLYRMEPRQWENYLAGTPFNAIHTIRVGVGRFRRNGQNPVIWDDLEEIGKNLDLADKLGLKVLLELGVYVKEIYEVEPGEETGRRLREVVSRFRRHPALLAYYLIDEPYVVHYERTRRAGEIVKQIDPYHPTVAPSLGYLESYKPTSELADILLVSCYPKPLAGNEKDVALRMSEVRKRVGNKKPIWFVAQSFGRLAEKAKTTGTARYIFPDRLQQRSMIYQGLLGGDAKGLIMFAWFGDRPQQSGPIVAYNPEYWKMLKEVLGELAKMKSVVLAENMASAVIQCDTPLIVRARNVDGKVWVLAVNPANAPAELTITSKAIANDWTNYETGKNGTGDGCIMKDSLGSQEVRFWSCDEKLVGSEINVKFHFLATTEKRK